MQQILRHFLLTFIGDGAGEEVGADLFRRRLDPPQQGNQPSLARVKALVQIRSGDAPLIVREHLVIGVGQSVLPQFDLLQLGRPDRLERGGKEIKCSLLLGFEPVHKALLVDQCVGVLQLRGQILCLVIGAAEGLCHGPIQRLQLLPVVIEVVCGLNKVLLLGQPEALVAQKGDGLSLLLHGRRRTDSLLVEVEDADGMLIPPGLLQHRLHSGQCGFYVPFHCVISLCHAIGASRNPYSSAAVICFRAWGLT